jgi:hypothetical protein
VAVLSSSFKSAISQNISQGHNFATIFHFIEISTSQDSIIYHFQFDSSNSTIIVSQGENISFLEFFNISSTISFSTP